MPWDFEQFIKERKFLHNVSPRTIEWYEQTFNWLRKYEPTEAGCKAFVIGMREGGLKAISCNSRIRVANAYFKWAELPLHIKPLKEDTRILPTFTPDQIRRLIAFRPKGFYQLRLHTLVLALLDTGTRIDEALSLTVGQVDLENLIFTVKGKGDKERKIPFSFELRKAIFRHLKLNRSDLLFATKDGHKLGRRVVLRDFKILCRKLGFEPPPRTLHAIRHTFATEYIRRGGSQFMLMKVLGHTTLEMTKKYVNFQTADLSAVHNALSPLSHRAPATRT
jgi:integrase/recombinase XerD